MRYIYSREIKVCIQKRKKLETAQIFIFRTMDTLWSSHTTECYTITGTHNNLTNLKKSVLDKISQTLKSIYYRILSAQVQNR